MTGRCSTRSMPISDASAAIMLPASATAPAATSLRPTLFGRRSIIPGFGLTFGFTLIWLSLIVLIPLSAGFIRSAGVSWSGFLASAFSDRALAASRLSFGAALVAATINGVFGLLIA